MAGEPDKDSPPKSDDAAGKAAADKAVDDQAKTERSEAALKEAEVKALEKRRSLGVMLLAGVAGLVGMIGGLPGAAVMFAVAFFLGNMLKKTGLFDGDWMKGISGAFGFNGPADGMQQEAEAQRPAPSKQELVDSQRKQEQQEQPQKDGQLSVGNVLFGSSAGLKALFAVVGMYMPARWIQKKVLPNLADQAEREAKKAEAALKRAQDAVKGMQEAAERMRQATERMRDPAADWEQANKDFDAAKKEYIKQEKQYRSAPEDVYRAAEKARKASDRWAGLRGKLKRRANSAFEQADDAAEQAQTEGNLGKQAEVDGRQAWVDGEQARQGNATTSKEWGNYNLPREQAAARTAADTVRAELTARLEAFQRAVGGKPVPPELTAGGRTYSFKAKGKGVVMVDAEGRVVMQTQTRGPGKGKMGFARRILGGEQDGAVEFRADLSTLSADEFTSLHDVVQANKRLFAPEVHQAFADAAAGKGNTGGKAGAEGKSVGPAMSFAALLLGVKDTAHAFAEGNRLVEEARKEIERLTRLLEAARKDKDDKKIVEAQQDLKEAGGKLGKAKIDRAVGVAVPGAMTGLMAPVGVAELMQLAGKTNAFTRFMAPVGSKAIPGLTIALGGYGLAAEMHKDKADRDTGAVFSSGTAVGTGLTFLAAPEPVSKAAAVGMITYYVADWTFDLVGVSGEERKATRELKGIVQESAMLDAVGQQHNASRLELPRRGIRGLQVIDVLSPQNRQYPNLYNAMIAVRADAEQNGTEMPNTFDGMKEAILRLEKETKARMEKHRKNLETKLPWLSLTDVDDVLDVNTRGQALSNIQSGARARALLTVFISEFFADNAVDSVSMVLSQKYDPLYNKYRTYEKALVELGAKKRGEIGKKRIKVPADFEGVEGMEGSPFRHLEVTRRVPDTAGFSQGQALTLMSRSATLEAMKKDLKLGALIAGLDKLRDEYDRVSGENFTSTQAFMESADARTMQFAQWSAARRKEAEETKKKVATQSQVLLAGFYSDQIQELGKVATDYKANRSGRTADDFLTENLAHARALGVPEQLIPVLYLTPQNVYDLKTALVLNGNTVKDASGAPVLTPVNPEQDFGVSAGLDKKQVAADALKSFFDSRQATVRVGGSDTQIIISSIKPVGWASNNLGMRGLRGVGGVSGEEERDPTPDARMGLQDLKAVLTEAGVPYKMEALNLVVQRQDLRNARVSAGVAETYENVGGQFGGALPGYGAPPYGGGGLLGNGPNLGFSQTGLSSMPSYNGSLYTQPQRGGLLSNLGMPQAGGAQPGGQPPTFTFFHSEEVWDADDIKRMQRQEAQHQRESGATSMARRPSGSQRAPSPFTLKYKVVSEGVRTLSNLGYVLAAPPVLKGKELFMALRPQAGGGGMEYNMAATYNEKTDTFDVSRIEIRNSGAVTPAYSMPVHNLSVGFSAPQSLERLVETARHQASLKTAELQMRVAGAEQTKQMEWYEKHDQAASGAFGKSEHYKDYAKSREVYFSAKKEYEKASQDKSDDPLAALKIAEARVKQVEAGQKAMADMGAMLKQVTMNNKRRSEEVDHSLQQLPMDARQGVVKQSEALKKAYVAKLNGLKDSKPEDPNYFIAFIETTATEMNYYKEVGAMIEKVKGKVAEAGAGKPTEDKSRTVSPSLSKAVPDPQPDRPFVITDVPEYLTMGGLGTPTAGPIAAKKAPDSKALGNNGNGAAQTA